MTSQELQYVEGLKIAVMKNLNLVIHHRDDKVKRDKYLGAARKKIDELEEKIKNEKEV
jgi:hypothetical protein